MASTNQKNSEERIGSVDYQGQSPDEVAAKAQADAQKAVDGVGQKNPHVSIEDPAPVSAADETSAAGPYTGKGAPKIDDPPLRSGQPGQHDLAVSLAQGAGAHTPPDPKVYDHTGRARR